MHHSHRKKCLNISFRPLLVSFLFVVKFMPKKMHNVTIINYYLHRIAFHGTLIFNSESTAHVNLLSHV